MSISYAEMAQEKLRELGVEVDGSDKDALVKALWEALSDSQAAFKQLQREFVYSCDIHAANLEIAEKSSTGKYERNRLVGIAVGAHNALKGFSTAPTHLTDSKPDRVCERIEKGIFALIESNKVKGVEDRRIFKPVTELHIPVIFKN